MLHFAVLLFPAPPRPLRTKQCYIPISEFIMKIDIGTDHQISGKGHPRHFLEKKTLVQFFL